MPTWGQWQNDPPFEWCSNPSQNWWNDPPSELPNDPNSKWPTNPIIKWEELDRLEEQRLLEEQRDREQQAKWEEEARLWEEQRREEDERVRQAMEARARPLPDGEYYIAHRHVGRVPFSGNNPPWHFLTPVRSTRGYLNVVASRDRYTIWKLIFEQSSRSYIISNEHNGQDFALDSSTLPHGLISRPFSFPPSPHQRFRILYSRYTQEFTIFPLQMPNSYSLGVGPQMSIRPPEFNVHASKAPLPTNDGNISNMIALDMHSWHIFRANTGIMRSFSGLATLAGGTQEEVVEPEYSAEYQALATEALEHCATLKKWSGSD